MNREKQLQGKELTPKIKMRNLRFPGRELEMNLHYQVPLERKRNLKARQVQSGTEATTALQSEEVASILHTVDEAATILHHQGKEDPEEKS